MRRSAFYLPGHVRHHFTGEFCIPSPPPADMVSSASSRALARSIAVEARTHRRKFPFYEASYEAYLGWLERVRKPHAHSKIEETLNPEVHAANT